MQDRKTSYAQASSIKSRSYLEYRKDMKKKAIAELEVWKWLENKLKQQFPKEKVVVEKSGADKFLWFLRNGSISREPDFVARVADREIKIEFQYAEKEGLEFYDFKVSKVAKKEGKSLKPRDDKLFLYIHKPMVKYAIFDTQWIMKTGKIGMVEAWRVDAFRVPAERFEGSLKSDPVLKNLCNIILAKNFILNFQHEFIDITKDKLSHLLQEVVDENKILKIIPKDLDSFFKVCFISDNLNRAPTNANFWLVYLLSYINANNSLEEIAKITYCLDFLYSKTQLKDNEIGQVVLKIKELLGRVKQFYQKDGSYVSTLKTSALEETRSALFAINLLEDLIQEIIFYYPGAELKPVRRIYENVDNIEKTCELLKSQ